MTAAWCDMMTFAHFAIVEFSLIRRLNGGKMKQTHGLSFQTRFFISQTVFLHSTFETFEPVKTGKTKENTKYRFYTQK